MELLQKSAWRETVACLLACKLAALPCNSPAGPIQSACAKEKPGKQPLAGLLARAQLQGAQCDYQYQADWRAASQPAS